MNIDWKYAKSNWFCILFFGFFNLLNAYLVLTNTYQLHELLIAKLLMCYEFFNTFLEYYNHSYQPIKEIEVYMIHHIFAFLTCFYAIAYYQPNTVIFQDLIWGSSILNFSTFFLNLRHLIPKNRLVDILFSGVFIYCRNFQLLPLILKILNGDYITNDISPIISYCLCVSSIFFYLLSLYWSSKILRLGIKALHIK